MNDVFVPESLPSKDGVNARLSTSPPKSGSFWSGLAPSHKRGITFPEFTVSLLLVLHHSWFVVCCCFFKKFMLFSPSISSNWISLDPCWPLLYGLEGGVLQPFSDRQVLFSACPPTCTPHYKSKCGRKGKYGLKTHSRNQFLMSREPL